MKARPPAERVFSRVVRGDGCWAWTGTKHPQGYGMFTWRPNGRSESFQAHRLVYELVVGEVPAGLELDHLCRNRGCVNPAHLEPVTRSENLARAAAAGRTVRSTDTTPVAGRMPHGTYSTYSNYRCRCEPCRLAGTEWYRAYRARKVAS